MGSPPTTNRVGGLIRKIEKPFKLWSCSLVHFYNSKVFNRGGKRKTGGEPPERILVSFHSFVWLGENQNLKLNFVWNRKFPDWNRPKWWKMADSFVVLYGNGVPKKSRAQKMKRKCAKIFNVLLFLLKQLKWRIRWNQIESLLSVRMRH